MELPKVVATDLDGTLVRSDETVSDRSVAVLRKLSEAGVTVVGVTGRGPRLVDLCRRDLPDADFLVLGQGSYVLDQRDLDAPEVVHRVRIPGADLALALTLLEAAVGPLSVLVESLDERNAPLWGDAHVVWPYPEWIPFERAEALRQPAYKGFASVPGMGVDELLAIARTVIPPSLATLTQAGMDFIELTAPGVDKATGLAVVARRLGVDPTQVCVFGDMPNDLPMFRWAGYRRVAVANAHPELLAIADEVTASNDDDGVAAWLERLF